MTKKIGPSLESAGAADAGLVVIPPGGAAPGGPGTTYPGSPAFVTLSKVADDDGRDEPARKAGGGAGPFLHAFRRHWPLAITLGLLCGAAATVAAWFLLADRYTASALLQVAVNEQQLVFTTADREQAASFEIYKGTQQQLVASEGVLTAALRKPGIAGLAILRNEEDPVRWLAKNLHVEFPGNAEIMRVSLTGVNPNDVATVVQAVVDAYMNEIVDAERNQKKARLDELNRLYAEKEGEMRNRRTELKQLAEQLGTGDTGALAPEAADRLCSSTPTRGADWRDCGASCSGPKTTCGSSGPGFRPCRVPRNMPPSGKWKARTTPRWRRSRNN